MSSISMEATCKQYKTKILIGVTPEQRDQLTDGQLQCPVCQSACSPTVIEIDYQGKGIMVKAWDGTEWADAYNYKVSIGP